MKRRRDKQTNPTPARAAAAPASPAALVPARWPTSALVAALLALFTLNALYAAVRNSGTCDELGAHIPSGYLYWKTGQFAGGVDNPPLGQLLIALPIVLTGCEYELFTEQHLLLFRLPALLMGLLLAGLVWRLATELWGRDAGLAALLLVVLSPNILAHATLATLDLPITFFVLLSVYALWRYVARPTILRLVLLSLALAAAVLTKVQGLLLLPIIAVALVLFVLWRPPAGARRLHLAASWLIMPAVLYALIHVAYLHAPFSAGRVLPPPFGEALAAKFQHSATGHFAYLLGDYSQTGWWYYFPVAILLKTPLPALLLVLVALPRKHSGRVAVFVLLPLAVLLAAALRSRINIGLRHVLPLYPFLFILAGYGATCLWRRRWQRIGLGVLGAWYLVAAVYITPHHLSYFNELTGGPHNGHKYLLDSNYDWGQNDHYLREHVARTGHTYQINPDPFRPTTGRLLINANALHGVPNGGPQAYAWLRRYDYQPVARIAYTWFEYDIPADAFPADPRVREIQQRFVAYLLAVRERNAPVRDPRLRVALVRTLGDFGANAAAFDEARALIAEHPGWRPGLGAAGELAVAWKLGALKFTGDEYLTGFLGLNSADLPAVTEPEIVAIARQIGAAPTLARLHVQLAAALLRGGDREAATAALETATRFVPEDRALASTLERLRDPAVAPEAVTLPPE